jgi:all-trans-nonaprenyl-diphosphate synthase
MYGQIPYYGHYIAGFFLQCFYSMNELTLPISEDLATFEDIYLRGLSAASGPLEAVIEYLLSGGGKRIRPQLVFLAARLSSPDGKLQDTHWDLAVLTELIHTASLVHDDLLDDATSRRGQQSCHLEWNAKMAVIAGDFMFAQASVKLGEIGSSEIVRIYASVLSSLCKGEVEQAQHRFDLHASTWDSYLRKSASKTACLFAAGTRSAAILNTAPYGQCQSLDSYGHNLGLAFQIVDDLLDFTLPSSNFGKPVGEDLRQGILTAPVLYALDDGNVSKELRPMLERQLTHEGDWQRCRDLIEDSGSLQRTMELARSYADAAVRDVRGISAGSVYRTALEEICEYVLNRRS